MWLVSEENLLWYTEGHKLWHDNTIKSNTFLSYYKGGRYWHEYVPIPSNENENSQSNNEEPEEEPRVVEII